MNRNLNRFCFVAVIIAGLVGCSKSPSDSSKKPAAVRDRLQGKAQVGMATNPGDAALNAGSGSTVYMWHGPHRYTLFFNKPVQMENGKKYVVEGIDAQKKIDEIGDPDQGKNGYPLASSCDRVVRMAWPGLAFDVTDAQSSALRNRVKRYPARPVFLVTKVQLDTDAAAETKKVADADEKELLEVSVAPEKQRAALIDSPATQTAPLWSPEGGTARCKLIIDEKGKVSELETGSQLCEAVQWENYSYQPRVEKGKPVRVKTEVEVRFDPRK